MIPPALLEIKLNVDSAEPDHLQIARQLEKLIRTGKLTEGERIPPTSTLVKMWKIQVSQVQRGMAILTRQGLLQRFPRRGTFVTLKEARPSIGILLEVNLMEEQAHFSRITVAAIENEIRDLGLNPRCYDALTLKGSEAQIRSRTGLEYDRRHQRFNGFIFVGGVALMDKYGHLANDYPIATLATARPDIDVTFDEFDFAYESAIWLAKRGCEKIACLITAPRGSTLEDRFLSGTRAAEKEGVNFLPHAFIDINAHHSAKFAADRIGYECAVDALKQWKQKEIFPEGIIISDDIVTRGVAVAIQSSLLSRQSPPQLVTAAVEDIDHFYALPTARYIRSAKETAKRLLQRYSAKAAGEPVPKEPDLIRGKICEPHR